MANRIKDALSPELYEYYKQNRNKYKRFASDLTLLQAQLFKGMVDERKFPAKKHRYNWQYECDCTTWLNNILNKICTFDDFRKLFKDRLKNFKFKSPEYYAECERIVAENDVEFVKNSLKAKGMRNYEARNYCYLTQIQENEQIYPTTSTQQTTEAITHNIHNKEYNYKIVREDGYISKESIPYIVTKHCKVDIRYFESRYFMWDCELNVKRHLNLSWDEFCKKYNINIIGVDVESFEFKCQCLAIILENMHKKNLFNSYPKSVSMGNTWVFKCDSFVPEIPDTKSISTSDNINENIKQQSETIWNNKDDFEYGLFCFGFIASFFVFGGIAYIFKHLIALFIYWIGYLLWLICNTTNFIGAILFNYNAETLPLDADAILDPLDIWQIGGWIYGTLVVIIVCTTIYSKIRNRKYIKW